ncbi:MAG: hypothetical protein OXP71_05790 [Candidatus Poribacteria bacterium]|nr:hypothetical protein [Candidatus Poribacteria bacterium]
MQYTISQCFDEWPAAQDDNQIAYRQCAREVYAAINPITLAERIAHANFASYETSSRSQPLLRFSIRYREIGYWEKPINPVFIGISDVIA